MKLAKLLRFQTYSLHIDPTFWSSLYEYKLNIWKLDDSEKKCNARISNNLVFLDRSSIQNAQNTENTAENHPLEKEGVVKVFNTRADLLEFFKKNKGVLERRDDTFFILLVHADLKQYSFDYYFALPTIYPSSPFYARLDKDNKYSGSKDDGEVGTIHCTLTKDNDSFILPWTVRNDIFKLYQLGTRRFRIAAADALNSGKQEVLFIRCHEPFKIRHTGWSSIEVTTVNLSQTMDPHVIAEQNAELNLKLMMWKHEPNLPLSELRQVKCLLIGSGTVGCGIARNLISWGVRNITFVDCANISHSNPVRQNLYTTLDIGKEKAVTAAENLSTILPSVISNGHTLDIPMPGHNHSSTEDDYILLDELVKCCDKIFLSTDSREGRWLPILLARKYGKDVVNIALGYETLVVQWITEDNACYFCTDPIGPRDTMTLRTIDEKCTITRPGISSIASAVAVELFVDIIRKAVHHDQIRFSLNDMQFICQKSFKNEQCCCCSIEMISELSNKGYRFVEEVKCDPGILEDITGYNEDVVSDLISVGDDEDPLDMDMDDLDDLEDAFRMQNTD